MRVLKRSFELDFSVNFPSVIFSTLNLMTEEILFEVYDCDPNGGNHFMGLAIVSVEELLVNPYQRQVLSLQTRPYQDDSVSGTLTLEVSTNRRRRKIVR